MADFVDRERLEETEKHENSVDSKAPETHFMKGVRALWRQVCRYVSIMFLFTTVLIVILVFAYFSGGSVVIKGLQGILADQIEIEFPTPGTTVVTRNGHPEKATFLLAASELWADTGITLSPGQSISVIASGKVNLAIHRLSEAAEYDTLPVMGWIGPSGNPSYPTDVKEAYRRELAIEPREPDGTLLAYLHAKGTPIPGKLNPKPGDGVIVVGERGEVRNDSSVPRTLWMVVNDAVLKNDEPSRIGYFGIDPKKPDFESEINRRPKDTKLKGIECARICSLLFGSCDESANNDKRDDPKDEKNRTPNERWQYILQKQYWNLWFDDNIGEFFIQIDFVEKI